MKKICVVLLILALLSGCGNKGSDSAGSGKAGKDGSQVVAKVGDREILASDIEAMLSQVPKQFRSRYSDAEMQRKLMDQFVDVKMLASEARKKNIDKKPEVKLKLEYIQDQLLAKQLEESLMNEMNVTDADIEKYYNEHIDKYNTPPRIKASHILVDNEKDAKKILKAIKGGGDFAKLAKEKSKCPSGPKGGDLGWFGKGKMDPAFEKVAFEMQKGQISDVVKTSFGYHIIRVDDIRPGREKKLDEVKKSIERTLKNELMNKKLTDLKTQLKKDMAVKINDEYFKTLDTTTPPNPELNPSNTMTPNPITAPAPNQVPSPNPTVNQAPNQVPGSAAPAQAPGQGPKVETTTSQPVKVN